MAANQLPLAINDYDVSMQSRRVKENKECIREFLDMIWDYQEPVPKDKQMTETEIDNLFDSFSRKIPDLCL